MYKKLLPQLALGPKTILFSNPCLDSDYTDGNGNSRNKTVVMVYSSDAHCCHQDLKAIKTVQSLKGQPVAAVSALQLLTFFFFFVFKLVIIFYPVFVLHY